MEKKQLDLVSEMWNQYLAEPRSIRSRQFWDDVYNFADGVFNDTMISADFVAYVASKQAEQNQKQQDKLNDKLEALKTKSIQKPKPSVSALS